MKTTIHSESLNLLSSRLLSILTVNGNDYFAGLSFSNRDTSNIHEILNLDLSLMAQAALLIRNGESLITVPFGYIPQPTDYDSIIINGIERAVLLTLKPKEGLILEDKKTRKALITNSAGQIFKVDFNTKDIYLFQLEKPEREILNKVLKRNSNNQVLELEDIKALQEILKNDSEFYSLYSEHTVNDLNNYRINLLRDSIIKPLNRILSVQKKYNDLNKVSSLLKGYLPKSLRLRNEFKVLTDSHLFPLLNKINPISILSEIREIKRGPVKVDGYSIPKEDRDIHESHMYKICPVETPEGNKIGLNLFLAKDSKIDPTDGSLIPGKSILGYSASLIPFIGHNEGARAIMGSKNLKQSLLLKYNEPPYVKSGSEKEISEFVKILNDPYQNEFIKNDELAQGINLLVAYMPYKGLNFEDAIVISDRLQKKDLLTSIHLYTLKTEVFSDQEVEIKIKAGEFVNYKQLWCIKTNSTGEKESLYIDENITGTVELIEKLSLSGKRVPDKEDFPYKDPPDPNRKIGIIIIKIREYRKIQLGDKLTARHGNKGVVGAIVPEDEMPHLPDGSPVDIILNPNGVISRMNLGQLLETHFAILYKYKTLVCTSGESLFTNDEIDYIERAGKPFQKINPEKLGNLLKKLFDHLFPTDNKNYHSKGKVYLKDGATGEYFENASVIGYQYFIKLNHLSSFKVNARNKGNEFDYNQMTLQPLKGKKNNGGQKIGEMEFAALLAHNVPAIMKEILNYKSEFKKDSSDIMPQATKAFFHYLHGLGLHAKEEIVNSRKTFSIGILDKDTLLSKLDAKEIHSSSYYQLVSITKYSCKCGEKSLEMISDLNQTINKKLSASFFKEKSKNIHNCAICKTPFSSSIINKEKIELTCTCSKKLFDIKQKGLSENHKESFVCFCNNCQSELEICPNIKYSYRFTDGGIFSENVFGTKTSQSWKKNYGFIELAVPIKHPFIKELELRYLPIIPPSYRPFKFNNYTYKPEGSSLNKLYEQIIELNQSPEVNINKLEKLVKELMTGQDSLFNVLKGKKGLIRNAILGRRADYSGRAVIIPAPEIHFDECKLPYFILERFFTSKISSNDPVEKRTKLKELIKREKPVVLLNRAPSLHKYNFLSFYISEEFYEDPVIGINPLVCGYFGADHDGDVMAVHLLLSNEAKSEAMKMMPSHNLISDANSECLLHFEQDIVLGLSIAFEMEEFWKNMANMSDEKFIKDLRECKEWNTLNTRGKISSILKRIYQQFGETICSNLAEYMMSSGFELSTKSGISISFFDLYELSQRYLQHNLGLPVKPDYKKYQEYESQCLEYLEKLLKVDLNNPVANFIETGARGNPKQVLQMVGLKGLSFTGRQEFNDKFFIKSNFIQGLDEKEYFYAAFKSRDAMMDKKLIAPVTGTILRELTSAMYDVSISEADCGSNSTKRTPFNCLSNEGICQVCYGKEPFSLNYYPIGTKVGIIAAQSIGERSSQLSMKSIHSLKENTTADIEKMNKLINIVLPGKNERVKYLLDNFFPEDTYIKKFKEIKPFSNIGSRHLSILLKTILKIDLGSKDILTNFSIDRFEELVSKGKIMGYTLKQLNNNHPDFLSRFGYIQLPKILKDVLDKSEIQSSIIKDDFFFGVK